jgi:hypothetical protein
MGALPRKEFGILRQCENVLKKRTLLVLAFLAVSQAFQVKELPRRCLASSKRAHLLPFHPAPLYSSRENNIEETRRTSKMRGGHDKDVTQNHSSKKDEEDSLIKTLVDSTPFLQLFQTDGYKKLPPMQVEDMNVLLYDIFLILNLSLSTSFWVTHRMSFFHLASAFNEGCLFSIFWIVAGLYHGSFLRSAVDGHYEDEDERGGPKAAFVLAMNTFVNATSLRLLYALLVAVIQHRPVGMDVGEQLLPIEIGVGLMMMSSWRFLHSSFTPRF